MNFENIGAIDRPAQKTKDEMPDNAKHEMRTEFHLERDWNPEEKQAFEVLSALQKAGHETYFVGGAVRDYLLGKNPKDIDLATSASAEEIKRVFGDRAYSIGQQAKHGIFVIAPEQFDSDTPKEGTELAIFRKDIYEDSESATAEDTTPPAQLGKHLSGRHADRVETEGVSAQEDAVRRDLTINALFWDPVKGEIVDYVGGRKDLEKGVIRFAGDPKENIEQDRMRLLRYFRFKGNLEFAEDPDSAKAIRAWLHNEENQRDFVRRFRLNPRLKPELEKILQSPARIAILEDLMQTGILKLILPEISALNETEQPPHHHSEGNVWEHTKLCFQNLPPNSPAELTWATLLHDIGKPITFAQTDPNDPKTINFHGHEKASEDLTRALIGTSLATSPQTNEATLGKGLGFDKKFVDTVSWLVKNHMQKMMFLKMKPSKQATLMDHPAFPLLQMLWQADSLSSVSPQPEVLEEKLRSAEAIEEIYQTHLEEKERKAARIQEAQTAGTFLTPEHIMASLRTNGWELDKRGVLHLGQVEIISAIPILKKHFLQKFETGQFTFEELQTQLKNITQTNGILENVVNEMRQAPDLREINKQLEDSELSAKTRKALKKKLNIQAQTVFTEALQRHLQAS